MCGKKEAQSFLMLVSVFALAKGPSVVIDSVISNFKHEADFQTCY